MDKEVDNDYDEITCIFKTRNISFGVTIAQTNVNCGEVNAALGQPNKIIKRANCYQVTNRPIPCKHL